jgi:hypothetical protein
MRYIVEATGEGWRVYDLAKHIAVAWYASYETAKTDAFDRNVWCR